MDDRGSTAQNRMLGAAWLIIGVVALLLAAAREPVSDLGALVNSNRAGMASRTRRILADLVQTSAEPAPQS
jgi:hypothetical protein